MLVGKAIIVIMLASAAIALVLARVRSQRRMNDSARAMSDAAIAMSGEARAMSDAAIAMSGESRSLVESYENFDGLLDKIGEAVSAIQQHETQPRWTPSVEYGVHMVLPGPECAHSRVLRWVAAWPPEEYGLRRAGLAAYTVNPTKSDDHWKHDSEWNIGLLRKQDLERDLSPMW